MGQQAVLAPALRQQHARKTGEVSVAAPECRLIGGDVLDGSAAFGNAGARARHDRPTGEDSDEQKSPEYR
ncbi:hypothetical protein J4732_14480 [Serratia marcescens]|uniref:Uncharacterized protein n=1 Tax=Serratia marcescens TaxID=615 RepID=A0A939SNU6_SERMA|nr:hypothetical protein [Serratia marcescens]